VTRADTAAFDLTPLEVVEALDRHIIGQHKAKRAVAVALRNHCAAASSRRSCRPKSARRTS
jgi:ATP-dependent protease HslVU (ClpYQ) ATPase subunit